MAIRLALARICAQQTSILALMFHKLGLPKIYLRQAWSIYLREPNATIVETSASPRCNATAIVWPA